MKIKIKKSPSPGHQLSTSKQNDATSPWSKTKISNLDSKSAMQLPAEQSCENEPGPNPSRSRAAAKILTALTTEKARTHEQARESP